MNPVITALSVLPISAAAPGLCPRPLPRTHARTAPRVRPPQIIGIDRSRLFHARSSVLRESERIYPKENCVSRFPLLSRSLPEFVYRRLRRRHTERAPSNVQVQGCRRAPRRPLDVAGIQYSPGVSSNIPQSLYHYDAEGTKVERSNLYMQP